jgi:hypothetical protein
MFQVPCPNTGIALPDGKSKVFIVGSIRKENDLELY